MNYVIGYLSLFDSELKLTQVTANSRLQALVEYLDTEEEFKTEDDIYEWAANCDSYISIIEV